MGGGGGGGRGRAEGEGEGGVSWCCLLSYTCTWETQCVCVSGRGLWAGYALTSSRTWMEFGVSCCASFKEFAESFSCPHVRKISAVLHHSQAQHSLLKLPTGWPLRRSLLAKDSSLLEPTTILGTSPSGCCWWWRASRHALNASWLPSNMDTNWIRLIVSLGKGWDR